jgi:hypothetical protein
LGIALVAWCLFEKEEDVLLYPLVKMTYWKQDALILRHFRTAMTTDVYMQEITRNRAANGELHP